MLGVVGDRFGSDGVVVGSDAVVVENRHEDASVGQVLLVFSSSWGGRRAKRKAGRAKKTHHETAPTRERNHKGKPLDEGSYGIEGLGDDNAEENC